MDESASSFFVNKITKIRFFNKMMKFVRKVRCEIGRVKLLAAIKAMQKSNQEHLDKRLDGIGQRLDGIGQRLDIIGLRLDGIGQRLGNLETSTNSIVKRLDSIEYKLGTLNESMMCDKVAFTRGHSYSKQCTVNSLISSVDWALTIQGCKHDPQVQVEKAFKIAENLLKKVRIESLVIVLHFQFDW